jgi:putative flippase GtrA
MTRAPAPSSRALSFIRYAAVGTLVFAVDLVITVVLSRHVHYLVANTLAFVVANVLQFVIAHVWVFRRSLTLPDFLRLYPATLSISLLGLVCSNLLVFVGVDLLGQSLVATKVVTAVIVLFVNYSLRVMLLYRSDSA